MTMRSLHTRLADACPVTTPTTRGRGMFALLALLALAAASPAGAVRTPDNLTDAGFLIPGAGAVTVASPDVRARLDRSFAWQSFRARYGDWTAMWNARTSSPHRAMGPAIRLPGFADRADAVEGSVRAFIAGNADLFGTPVLETSRVQKVNGTWYVSFQQTVRGMAILFADWEFCVGSNGNLMMFGADAERVTESDFPAVARIPAAVAREAARAGLRFDPLRDRLEGGDVMELLPVATEQGQVLRPVLESRVRIADPPAEWRTLVDATTGEVLMRHNRILNAIGGTVTGTVHPNLPTDPLSVLPLKNLTVNVGATPVPTNGSGGYSASPGGTVTVSAALRGLYSDVNRQDGVLDASFSAPGVTDPATVNIAFNAGNSHDAERDAFYNVNFVHDYVRTLDPGLPLNNLDYVAPTNVNINSTCNAYYDPSNGSVNFYAAGGGCPNTATMPDVVFHEYGHGVNEHVYYAAGQPNGMSNGALHEGMADVLASMIQDTSHMGKGFFGPGTVLRELANTLRWPQDASGDGHATGMIIGGAFWDLRLTAGLAVAAHDSHFAKYGTPDDPNDGIAMNEFFVATLVADDDDANLGNGTPHATEIVNAFNLHGIGTVFYMNFVHTPLADQPGAGPYPVTAVVTYNGPFGALSGTPTLYYAINNGGFNPVAMSPTGNPNEYTGSIPGANGAVVRYYIGAVDTYGAASTEPDNAPVAAVNRFVAGPAITLQSQNMESDPGWTVGAVGDNATTGLWLRADPVGTQVTAGIYVQPEDDHTGAGVQCWVTGNAAPGAGAGTNDVDNGRTTLTSSVFDATAGGNVNPIASYWRWYSNNQGAAPGEDFWRVDVSNDGGTNWTSVESTNQADASWRRIVFRIADYVTPTSTMKLRFIAEDANSGSLVEAAVDDFDLLAFSNVVGVGDAPTAEPLSLALASAQAAGGPMRLSYTLPAAGDVTLRLYDLGGREVRTLVTGFAGAGPHSTEWDGRDDRGMTLPSGTYFARLVSGGAAVSRTLIRTR
jgi:hypothetical protein